MRLALPAITLLAIATLLFLMPGASAAIQTDRSCSFAHQPDTAGNFLEWKAYNLTSQQAGTGCSAGSTFIDITAGGSYDLRCVRQTSGVPTALPPTAITISVVHDSTSFPSNNPTVIRSISLTGTDLSNCANGDDNPSGPVTFYCTDDGDSGGSPRAGIHRIHIRVQRTTVPTYDTSSDTGTLGNSGYGIVRCTTNLTLQEPSTAPTGNDQYKGGDAIGVRANLTAATYRSSGTTLAPRVTCDEYREVLPNTLVNTGATDITVTLKGAATNWEPSCDLQLWGWPTQSLLYTGTNYTLFVGGSGTSAGDGGRTVDITRSINRTLISHSLDDPATGPCSPPYMNPYRNRGEQIMVGPCHWFHAATQEMTGPPVNELVHAIICDCDSASPLTAYPSPDPYGFVTGDNVTFDSQNRVTSNHTVKTDMPFPANHLLQQRAIILSYGASRTEAELYNWGIANFTVNLTDLYNITSITNSRTASGPNATQFSIGDDNQFVQVFGLLSRTGAPISGAPMDCHRVNPDMMMSGTLSLGPTDASGDSAQGQFVPIPPPGVWEVMCETTLNANYGWFNITFNYTSTFSGNLGFAFNDRPHNDTHTNVTFAAITVNESTGQIRPLVLTPPVNLTIRRLAANGTLHETFDTYPMNLSCALCGEAYAHVPTAEVHANGSVFIAANFNIAGVEYVHFERMEGFTEWLIAHDTVLESHNLTLSNHTTRLDSHDTVLESHNLTLANLTAWLNSHDSVFDSHNLTLSNLTAWLNAHDSVLDSHNLTLSNLTAWLNAHDSVLDSHNLTLSNHTARLDAHDSVLDSVNLSDSTGVHVTAETVAANNTIYVRAVFRASNGTNVSYLTSAIPTVGLIESNDTGYHVAGSETMVGCGDGCYQAWVPFSGDGEVIATVLYEIDGRRHIASASLGGLNLEEITLLTAFDEWLPLIVWGILMMMSFRRGAWLPAMASVLNIAAALPNPDIIPLSGQVMLFVVAYFIYHLAERGILPSRDTGE